MADPRAFPLPISYGETEAVKNSGGFLVNWEAEAAPADARTPVTLRGSPGLKVFSAISNFPVVDGLVINNACYVATKVGIYRVFPDGGSYRLGTISVGVRGRCSTNGLAFVIADGLRTWSYTFRSDEQSRYDTNAPYTDFAVELTGTPNYYPSSTIAYLDQRLIFDRRDTSQFFNTNLLSLTVDGTNFKSAESSPDNVVGVFVDHQILTVFGVTTTEFFSDSGVGDSPFDRVPGGVVEHGAAGPYCFAKISNNTFVLSNEGVVYAFQGYVPRPISTPAVTNEIKMRNRATATSFCYIDGDHYYYQLNLEANGPDVPGISLVYDLATDLWHVRRDEEHGRHRASCYMLAFGKHLVGDFSTGVIYEMSTDFYDNAGDPLVAEIVTGPIPTGGREAMHAFIELEVDVGNGTALCPDPVIGMEASNDDGKTFGSQRLKPIGKVGRFKNRVRWFGNGSSRMRRYRFKLSDPVKRYATSQAWIGVR